MFTKWFHNFSLFLLFQQEEIPDIMEDMAHCINGGPQIEPNDFIIEVSWKERRRKRDIHAHVLYHLR